MKPVEYVFHIDVFTPDTLPMARLAQYLAELAKVIGHQEHTHFVRVDRGSANIVHKVDVIDAPKVEQRLASIQAGGAPKELMKALDNLNGLLAHDNATGALYEAATNTIAVSLPGRNRPRSIEIPAFRDQAVLEGKLVNIGGRDMTAHATLQDGEVFHTNISMSRLIARDLAPLLYGPSIRLHGDGKYERHSDGVWKVSDFKVDRYAILDEDDLEKVLGRLRESIGPERLKTLRTMLEKDRREGASEL